MDAEAQREWFEERAGILEFEAEVPRAEAEQAASMMLKQLLRERAA